MNAMYDFGREGFLDAQISWSMHTIRAVLIDTTRYTADLANNRWLSDIPVEARIAVSGPLTNKTIAKGIAGADPAIFSAVTGPPCAAVVVFRDNSSVASTSRLIGYIVQAVNLPVTPSGTDIRIDWDTASNKIFRL